MTDIPSKLPAKPPAGPARSSGPIIAGIGASAGGIEALQAFFEALPANPPDIAFVVVVHLSPEHHSELDSVLAHKTKLPVEVVKGTIPLQAAHIYVIPPDRHLEITDTHVGAYPFKEPRGQRAPIDTLFRSLAQEHGEGFALIFSGSGSDGAIGVKAVKEAGGIILVQDPKEAVFDAMPRAAIATGVADLVLPVREIAGRLVDLAHGKQRLQEMLAPAPSTFTGEVVDDSKEVMLDRILAHLHTRTGHDLSHYKRATVLRRLARRMQVQHRETLDDYLDFLRQNGDEARALFSDMLISVTMFFRDQEAFTALQKKVIGPLFENQQGNITLRVWVPGCATGEEAYSIAMLLLEEAARRDVWAEFQVFATDLDDGALAIAREGSYLETISADVSEARLERFFRKKGDRYCVTKELRDCVLFANHSLIKDPPFARLDLISCRNLLIYLDRELQGQVFAILRYALRRGGYLFLGASENAEGNYFQILDKKHHLFQTREAAGNSPSPLPEMLYRTPHARQSREHEWLPPAVPVLSQHRSLLEHLGPPSILVNAQYQVLNLSETAGHYLQPAGGPLSHDITTLVRADLRIDMQKVLAQAFQRQEVSISTPVQVAFNGKSRPVTVMVYPQQSVQNKEPLALVVFIENSPATTSGGADGDPLQDELHHTRAQLGVMREEYESATEELRAANEEYQSVNEEYRSTAEELETSKEELQSINEELLTVNNELKSKLEETARTNNDLENLMAATEIATLFLDRDLCIHRFTAPLTGIFNIKISDRGRPIGDFTHQLDYTELQTDAHQVLNRLTPIEREIHSRHDQWYLMRLRPYRTSDDHIDGVVITFVDITERKLSEVALSESREQLAHELTVIQRLHRMVMRVMMANNMQTALDEILQTALDLLAADFGNIQLFDSASETLEIIAQRHLTETFLDTFRKIGSSDNSTFGRALRSRERSVIEDIATDKGYQPYRELAAATGYRAVQTTPLLNRSGELVGALSTYWRQPYILSERDERLLDLLMQQAGDLINRLRSEETMRVNAIQLQQQALELRSHDQRKNEFLGLLGHELRNPLAAMISSLQALTAMEPGDQRQTPLLTMLKSQCRHMAHLVDDLLDVSRISTGKIMLRRLPHLLQDTVTASVEAITPQLDDRQHRFTLDLPPQPVWLNADPVRLRQIISNLLSNAVKYTETGGELTLSVQHDGGAEVSISIRDNGIGIANDALVNIFEPFTQVQQTQEQFQDGLGLGLALVKKLVELHDGTVSAHSEGPGQGCEIKVQLPVLEAPPLQQSKTDSVQAAPVIPQRILLIDDNVNITSALEILLQMSGHEVRVCNQSREALAVAREFHPDVALVDIAMPEMDGLQVAQQLRTELAQQPMKLIAVTGYGTEDDIHNIRDAGFDAHLLKPVELPELNLAIAKVLSGPRTDGSSG